MRNGFLLLLTALLGTGCKEGEFGEALFGNYFVRLNDETNDVVASVNTLAVLFGFEPIHMYDSALMGFSARLPHAVVPKLEERPEIDWIKADEPEEYMPPDAPDQNPDSNLGDLPDFEFGSDEVPPGILRMGGGPDLLNGLSEGYSGIHVAVIDTGVDLSHPDLNIIEVVDLVGESTGDFADGDDVNGHGTHVSGTIGAVADGSGVAGVAPGASIHAVRVLDDEGSGTFSDIIAGLEYAIDTPDIRVVNMSLGGPMPSGEDALKEAVQAAVDAGIMVCIAAGNEAQDTENVAPAGYNLGIVVSAYDTTGGDNGFADFSNFGGEVDIAAPGVSIISTYPSDDYALLSGTSMATPHVAGSMVLYLSTHPDATPAEALEDLTGTGEDGYQGQGNKHPEPFVDLAALVAAGG